MTAICVGVIAARDAEVKHPFLTGNGSPPTKERRSGGTRDAREDDLAAGCRQADSAATRT